MGKQFTIERRPITTPRKKHKYNAKPVVIDGIRFPSTKEGVRYVTLKQLERSGEITNLELQPRFILYAPNLKAKTAHTKIGTYRADFSYFRDGQKVIEDVKGVKTDVYKLKKKLVEASYGVTIKEV